MINIANMWQGWELEHWNRANAFHGMTLRQRMLLDLEATYFDTQFTHLRPWSPRVQPDPDTGKWRVMRRHEREPGIKHGFIKDKVDKVLGRIFGEGKTPDLKVDDATKKEIAESNFGQALYHPGFDSLAKGSACVSFILLTDGKPEFAHLDTTWCEPIFVARAGSARAESIAAELTAAKIDFGTPAEGEFLPTPEDATAHDVCFLRYERVFDEQMIANEFGEFQRGRRWRRRRDYLLNATIIYEDQQLSSLSSVVGEWIVKERIEHNFGFLPVEWARSKGAKDGDIDGPSFISEPLRSMAAACDYMMSQKDDSIAAISWPKLVTVNLKDRIAVAFGAKNRVPDQNAGSEDVIEYQGTGNTGAGSAFLLEPSGSGVASAKTHIDDLKTQIDRVSGVPEHDPQLAAGTLSGQAIRMAKEPLVATVTDAREPIAALISGIVRKYQRAKKREPKVAMIWPPVIAITADELLSWATALQTARTAGLISQETAVGIYTKLLEVPDLDAKAELARIQADEEAALEKAAQALPPEPSPGQ